jgi:hypothetical protein
MPLALGTLPSLRPGRPVLRRDAHSLQVGLGAHPVVLPARPAVVALLRALDPARSPDEAALDPDSMGDPAVRAALEALEVGGHLQPAPDTAALGRRAVALTLLAPGVQERLAPLLATAGLTHDEAADVRLVVSAGPLPRSVSDDLVQSGVPHLLVGSLEGRWRIGPFVVPGVTACLRCVDAHEAAGDPRRGLLLAQAARHARHHPEPSDPLQELAALSWALRDLRAYLDGAEPGTWSATVDLPAPEEPRSAATTTAWLRHRDCGCAWDLLDLP